jgi:GNAT superfamily N-acetyltransferase
MKYRSWKLLDVPMCHRPALVRYRNHKWSVFAALYQGAWDAHKAKPVWQERAKGSWCIVAFEDGHPVAIAATWDTHLGVYVAPAFRRRGIGTELAKRMARKLRRIGIDNISAIPFTTRGMKLYESANDDGAAIELRPEL